MVREVTSHWFRVKEMMVAFGQMVPLTPTEPDEHTRILRARLILEEAFETIEKGLGVDITLDIPASGRIGFDQFGFEPVRSFNMSETADGCADLSVVTIGTLVACGLPDEGLLQLVDENNLNKVQNGHVDEHGKFIKPVNHQPPDIDGWLVSVGREGK